MKNKDTYSRDEEYLNWLDLNNLKIKDLYKTIEVEENNDVDLQSKYIQILEEIIQTQSSIIDSQARTIERLVMK